MTDRSERPRRIPVPVRVFRLGEEPPDDLTTNTTAEERFEMVAILSQRMLEFSRAPVSPSAPRGTPVRVIRP